MSDQDEFLRYYQAELAYLRNMGRQFAERYPKLANRLDLSPEECADPHVERLIESFAFLTARLQRQLDAEFPQVSAALLGTLYPHLVNPIAPMTVAQFEVDPAQTQLTTGYTIPRHTQLFTQTPQGLTCRFRTCYPTTLWPLRVVDAGFVSPAHFEFLDAAGRVASVLRIRLESVGIPLRELKLKRLRFYINGSPTLVNTIYELAACNLEGVMLLRDNDPKPVRLPQYPILAVGLGPEDDVISYPPQSHSAYRLLQEYFAFPEKFYFFDIDALNTDHPKKTLNPDPAEKAPIPDPASKTLDILILLSRAPREKVIVDRDTFRLGCTPIVNLFPRTAEPIRLDHLQSEYRVVADMRRERTTEIHTVQSVSASSNPNDETVHYEPFYGFQHRADGRAPHAYWQARRAATGRDDRPGTDVYLSFLDRDFSPRQLPSQTVFVHTLCTNRELAMQVPAGAQLQIEDAAPLTRIRCLHKPTPPAYPPQDGATLWALVSNLTLNHLPLSGGREGLEALRSMLRLYSFSDRPSTLQQINGIREMSSRQVVRRISGDAWRGFCPGTEISLTFDENMYVGSGAFLLAAVLHRCFPLFASVNSFTQLVIYSLQREGEWKRFPAVAGDQPLL